MLGIHTAWCDKDKWEKIDYLLYTSIASLATWKKYYNTIDLYCDEKTKSAYETIGILKYYNNVHIIKKEEEISDKIFWAANKIYSYKATDVPFCSIDQDAVVWNPLKFNLNVAIQGLHYENPNWRLIYETPLRKYKSYFPKEYPLDVIPINAGLMAFYDNDYKNFYCDTAIKFMKEYSIKNPISKKNLRTMEFAEQRLSISCALQFRKTFDVFDSIFFPPPLYRANPQNVMHIWDFKRAYNSDCIRRHGMISHIIKQLTLLECNEYVDIIQSLDLDKSFKSKRPHKIVI